MWTSIRRCFSQLQPLEVLSQSWWSCKPWITDQAISLPIFSLKNKQSTQSTISLNPEIFNHPLRRDIIHNVFLFHKNYKRITTHRTKRIGEMHGSRRKLRPQKGTGRARLGHRFAPQLKGGAKAHGPVMRDWTIKLNKKVILKGLQSILSARIVEGKFLVIDPADFQDISKTKQMAELFNDFVKDRVMVLHEDFSEEVSRNANKLHHVNFLNPQDVNVKSVLDHTRILATPQGIENLTNDMLSKLQRYYCNQKLNRKRKEEAKQAEPIEEVVVKSKVLKEIIKKYELDIPTEQQNNIMASSLLFLNSRGEVLIYRSYRDDVSRNEVSQFCTQVVAAKEASENPLVTLNGIHYMHITHQDIILVVAATANINAALIVTFLHKAVTVFQAYFGGEFNENSIRKNFVLIYELLDEVMDFGFPQIVESDILKQYITQGRFRKELGAQQIKDALIQATGVTNWRQDGIKYKKNEVYIDVIESVNVLLSNSGSVLRAEVAGQIVIKSKLSYMPECKFGMNDKLSMQQNRNGDRGIAIEDIKFHQCVRLGRFDQDRAITFIPPDGVFELMSYRVTENVILPFKVKPVILEVNNSKIEIALEIKAMYDRHLFASNVVVKIPVPRNTGKCKQSVETGKCKYEPDQEALM